MRERESANGRRGDSDPSGGIDELIGFGFLFYLRKVLFEMTFADYATTANLIEA